LPVKVEVAQATQEELEGLLEAMALFDYAMPRLQDKSAAVRLRSINLLLRFVENEHLNADFGQSELHPLGKKAREAIRPLAKDADETVKTAAQNALRSLGDEHAILSFLKPFPPKNYRDSHSAYEVTRWCRNGNCGEKAAKHIITFFESDDEENIVFALGFFANFDYKPAQEKLLKLLDHVSPTVRLRAVEELRTHPEARKKIPAVLTKLLKNPNKEFRVQVLREAERWREELVDQILPFFKDGEPSTRSAAVYALGRSPNPKVTKALLAATRDSAASVRAEAVVYLGFRSTNEAFDRIVELLADPDREVRHQAANGLRWLNQPRCLAPLRKRLNVEADKSVRQMIERTIGDILLHHPDLEKPNKK
jgi:HEAT repeat protein